ncbi:hypothetical protein G5V59_21885 [Nocardioides sp. W3-2-3]|uniref:hypothetical protein n=1 Tax=Nocardioides convexus TaxID=2712224 RepID=UPI0024184BD5|nr:hypothetical protein [Nocardioides convexus]NHA01555.1 hypothetical protein [Nocardioides convexus]
MRSTWDVDRYVAATAREVTGEEPAPDRPPGALGASYRPGTAGRRPRRARRPAAGRDSTTPGWAPRPVSRPPPSARTSTCWSRPAWSGCCRGPARWRPSGRSAGRRWSSRTPPWPGTWPATDPTTWRPSPAVAGSRRCCARWWPASLLRQQATSVVEHRVAYLRERNGLAVGLVVESPDDTLYGLEVITAASLRPHQFERLRALARRAGPRFRGGVVLTTAGSGHQYGPRLWGLPIATVWAG